MTTVWVVMIIVLLMLIVTLPWQLLL